MIDESVFLNEHSIWLISISAFVLLAVFVGKELKIPLKAKSLRILASIIAVIALALMALRPTRTIEVEDNKLVVITEGYDEAQLDSIQKTNEKLQILEYVPGQSIVDTKYPPSSVVILGNGLRTFDVWQLRDIPTTFIGPNEPSGISRLNYDRLNYIDNKAKFHVQYRNGSKGHRIFLEGPGGLALDSIALVSEKIQDFNLSTDLKADGKFVFKLTEKDSMNNVLSRNPLPINVIKTNNLKVLLINDFPTFESKYLKNYLISQGHQLTVKSQLSKGKFKYEFYNVEKNLSPSFSQTSLKEFDIAIVDANTINKLSSRESRSLTNAIRDDGLGLLIQPDAGYYEARSRFASLRFSTDGITESTIENLPGIRISKYPYRFSNAFLLEPIWKSNSRILSAYKRVGEGRVGTTVIQDTYQLILKGKTSAYKALWTKTIKKISKKNLSQITWDKLSMAYKNEPFEFQLRTQIPDPIVTDNEGLRIPIERHPNNFSLWKGITYPRNSGWNQLLVQQDSLNTLDYFVCDTLQWSSLKAFESIDTNSRLFNNDLVSEQKINKTRIPINPLWFLIAFLISVGYLWLAPKL